ncbi:MAG TPA: LuxR C-terminal-related transcriptional regulator [Actinomycetota bacterium]
MSHPAPGGSPPRSTERSEDALEVRSADGVAITIRSRARIRAHDPSFTRRQTEILGLVGDGLSNTEIAEALCISRRTVEKHVESIHMKAGTGTRARLVAFARIHSRIDER